MNFTENTLFDISSGFVLSETFTVSHLNTNIVSTKKGLNHVNGTPKTPLWQKNNGLQVGTIFIFWCCEEHQNIHLDITLVLCFSFVCYLFSQLVMTLIGVLANAATYAAIKRNKTCFSEAIRVLLLNQSLLDCLACLFAVIILLQVSFVYVFSSYNNNIHDNIVWLSWFLDALLRFGHTGDKKLISQLVDVVHFLSKRRTKPSV